jgi:hypothetical protein
MCEKNTAQKPPEYKLDEPVSTLLRISSTSRRIGCACVRSSAHMCGRGGKAGGGPSLIFQVPFELCLSAAAVRQQIRAAFATFL